MRPSFVHRSHNHRRPHHTHRIYQTRHLHSPTRDQNFPPFSLSSPLSLSLSLSYALYPPLSLSSSLCPFNHHHLFPSSCLSSLFLSLFLFFLSTSFFSFYFILFFLFVFPHTFFSSLRSLQLHVITNDSDIITINISIILTVITSFSVSFFPFSSIHLSFYTRFLIPIILIITVIVIIIINITDTVTTVVNFLRPTETAGF